MDSEIIGWSKLDCYFTVIVTDVVRDITLEMNIAFWEDEKIILESWDFVYSMMIFRDDWVDGQFIFWEVN